VKASWDLAGLHEIYVAERSFNKPFCKKFYNDILSFYMTVEVKQFQSIINYQIVRAIAIYNLYSYNKSQRDALFLKFILIKNYMFRIDLLSIVRILNTVYTEIGICHADYVDCLLARTS
jgi:hypothetical protein